MPAFVGGGWVPQHLRGTQHAGLVAMWDWYSTLASLAGVPAAALEDRRAAAAGLHPIDSVDLSGVLFERSAGEPEASPARRSIALGMPPQRDATGSIVAVAGLIEEGEGGQLWKMLVHSVQQSGWTGPLFPNSTTHGTCFDGGCVLDCSHGCLFELSSDPTEHVDRSREPALAARVAAMRQAIAAAEATKYLPVRCVSFSGGVCNDSGFGGVACDRGDAVEAHNACADPRACGAAVGRLGAAWGPWLR